MCSRPGRNPPDTVSKSATVDLHAVRRDPSNSLTHIQISRDRKSIAPRNGERSHQLALKDLLRVRATQTDKESTQIPAIPSEVSVISPRSPELVNHEDSALGLDRVRLGEDGSHSRDQLIRRRTDRVEMHPYDNGPNPKAHIRWRLTGFRTSLTRPVRAPVRPVMGCELRSPGRRRRTGVAGASAMRGRIPVVGADATPLPSAISISIRQWSLPPHSSGSFRAPTFTRPAIPFDANAKSS